MSNQPYDAVFSEPMVPEEGSWSDIKDKTMLAEEVLAMIETAQTIAICGHVNPDGDSLGSALALRDLIRAMGKQADVLLGQECPAPELYGFLPDYEFIHAHTYAKTPDLFIVVDASTTKRLGGTEKFIGLAENTLVIDHHAHFEGFTEHYFGDISAPATASLIWEIIRVSNIKPTLNMATYCYVGLMTDTGRFAFRNTDRTAFIDAREMVDVGVCPSEMNQLVYENKSLATMRLEALIIGRIRFSNENGVAYSYILHDDLDTLGLKRDDTEQIPTILRSIKGVEVAILFREEGDEGVRVNLRSRSVFNVGAFACELGGGGHAGAAGLTLFMTLDEAIAHVLSHLTEAMSATDGT